MAYTKTTWVDGVTPVSAQNMNNLETQYDEAKADLDTHKAENANKHIKESGSNENGSYIKFDDGTMICRTSINLVFDNAGRLSATWVHPAEFIQQPSVSLTYKHTAGFTPLSFQLGQMYLSGASGESSSTIYIPRIFGMTDFQPGDSMNCLAIAIGRWK